MWSYLIIFLAVCFIIARHRTRENFTSELNIENPYRWNSYMWKTFPNPPIWDAHAPINSKYFWKYRALNLGDLI